MSSDPDLHAVFPPLRPPPGGLEALRARLDRPARRWIGPVVVAGAAAIVLGLILWVEPSPPSVALGVPWARPPEPVQILPEARDRLAVQRIETADARVVLYRIASVPPVPGG